MNELHYHLTIKLFFQEKSFGPGPMLLLQGVEETGSLHKSAAAIGMAYSKAWKMIQTLEEAWGFSLLYRCSGGSKGGGSVLTPKGKLLLEQYQNLLQDVEKAAQASFEKHFGEIFLEEIEK